MGLSHRPARADSRREAPLLGRQELAEERVGQELRFDDELSMSSLAARLDQAEAQLMFKNPDSRAKPVGLENWELIIDTTRPVWTVFHAEYKSRPLW